MNARVRTGIVVSAVMLLAATPGAAQLSRDKPKPKGSVRLVPSMDAIVEGEPFDLALHFQLTPGWHIYWQNSGESGLPPIVTWMLPDGFAAGQLQFPIPKRHHNAAGITTNILEGNPVLLLRMTPPEHLRGQQVTLEAKVRYLICAGSCLREEADVGLALPVRPPGGKAGLANEELFRQARRALPKGESKYLSVAAEAKPARPSRGQAFDLLVNIDIKRGFHIQSHKPLNPAFIKSDIFLERVDGVFFKQGVYPAPKFRTLKGLGKVSEYAGRITVRIPGEVEAETASAPKRLGGLVRYQACDDKGNCFPPEAVAFSLALGKEGASGIGAVTDGRESGVAPATESAPPGERPAEVVAEGDGLQAFLVGLGLPGLLLGCFLYGLSINATPCVLPLLSIKVLGFVQQAHESRRRTLMLGLAFGAGVVLFFVILGFLAAAGKNVLQYPAAVIALGAVVMALALSMLGVYTLQVPTAAAKLDASIQREGMFSSFGKGTLAPVLGFACTGPLLAGAFGWATQQPPRIAILAFLAAGLGMASPYMLLGANPNWLSFLPKPGHWMITFERIMGFLLLAMVVWLLHPLVEHMGSTGLEWTLVFLVAIAMGCWLLGRIDAAMSASRRWRYRGGAGVIVLTAGVGIYGWALAGPPYEVPWRPWSSEQVEDAVRAGNTVLVDFTAAYCTVCKANKKLAFNTQAVGNKIESLGIIPLQGDFTSGDEKIAEALRRHGRFGVPLNLIYPAGKPDAPIVLKTKMTKKYLLQKLNEAGPSRPTRDVASAATALPGS